MECPMRFNNPCCDSDTECVGEKCMWYVMVNGNKGCAVAWSAVSINVNPGHIDFGISDTQGGE